MKKKSVGRSTDKKEFQNNNLELVYISDLINNQWKFCIDELENCQAVH